MWEVDEFGQFVKRTQSPSHMHAFEAVQHQHHQHRLHNQLTYAGQPPSDSQDAFGFDQSSHLDSNMMDPRGPVNMYDPNVLRRERSLSTLSALSKMDGELVAQMQEQEQRARAERQNNVPSFIDSSGNFSEMERYRRDAFDLLQVQERQQQVEAAAAARVLGMSTNSGMDGIDSASRKSGGKRPNQPDSSGNGSLLSGLSWPILRDDPSPRQTKESIHDLTSLAQSRGGQSLWGRDAHEYGNLDQQMQGAGRRGSVLSPEHAPILPTPSATGTPQSSFAGTLPEPLHMPGSWGSSSIQSNDLLSHSSHLQPNESFLQTSLGSAATLSQPGWKSAVALKPKSLAEIQQEEAARRRAEEKGALETAIRSMSTTATGSSMGLGSWATASHNQVKTLQEIQEEEARRAASLSSQSNSNAMFQSMSSGKVGDPPPWGLPNASEKSNSLYEAGDKALVNLSTKKRAESGVSVPVQSALGQLTEPQAPISSVFDDGDFIEPKESKKNKKRAAKVKGLAPSGKFAVTGSSAESSHMISPFNTVKSGGARLTQLEMEEILPPSSLGHSLADFLNLREESSASPQQLPAWSSFNRQARSAKSLKEIQEAEKKAREEQEQQNIQASLPQRQVPPPLAKPVTLMTRSGSGGVSAWQRPSVSSPSPQSVLGSQQLTDLVNPAIASNTATGNLRSKVGVFEDDDDLFWDYGRDVKMTIGSVKQNPKSERSVFIPFMSFGWNLSWSNE